MLHECANILYWNWILTGILLDPDLKKVLEQIKVAGKIGLKKVSPQEYRQLMDTAEFNSLSDQGETFVSKLRVQGVTATGVRALEMMYGFVSLFELSPAARNILIMASKLVGEKQSGPL